MNKMAIFNSVSRAFHKTTFQLKKHSPEILVATGVVGTVVSAVFACKATLKVNEVTSESKKNIEKIHAATENGQTEAGEEYTAQDSKKDLTIVYAQTGLKLAKLYAPAVILGAASLGCIITSHNIIRKRNVALAAAYTAVDKSFKEYRGRVVERFGKDLDRELKYNIKAKEIEETVVDENGKETTVKKTVPVIDPTKYSEYAVFFDDGCKGWEKDAEHNLFFLKQQQNYANDLLKARGHVFLNEIYDMLGIPRTTAGQAVGWFYDEKDPDRDNFIDFGIYNLYSENARDFVNGRERVILLDFNVDGEIWQLIS
jgi:hypothetical protein